MIVWNWGPIETRDIARSQGVSRATVTSNITLAGAINPDFGQVEVDPAVVNLTAYETFFDEKRRFFIEGSEARKAVSLVRAIYDSAASGHPVRPDGV